MGKVRVKINNDGIRELMSGPGAEKLIGDRTQAVVDACNAQSSWGGYEAETEDDGTRARGRVWTYARQDRRGQTERVKRLIRNLDAQ